jgi:hypothetical protein
MVVAQIAAAVRTAADPWTERIPLVLRAVTPEPHDGGWLVRDANGTRSPSRGASARDGRCSRSRAATRSG